MIKPNLFPPAALIHVGTTIMWCVGAAKNKTKSHGNVGSEKTQPEFRMKDLCWRDREERVLV